MPFRRSAHARSMILALSLLCSAAASAGDAGQDALRKQVEATERAFAQSMADRDFEAFASFLAEEAVFISGDTPLRGSQAVGAAWKAYFETPEAPFSWAPEMVEVLQSGALALSSGPVYDAAGERVATFNSVWRRSEGGDWKIVFDKGSRYCNP